VKELLLSIDTAKASGPDRLSGRLLKSTATSIAPAITRLFNLSLRTGKLPVEWKVAQVIPIPKSSDASDPANYRLVSLLSVLSKLLEKHIRAHLLDHLEQHSPIHEQQWGFTKGKSTTGALLTATDSWHKALEEGSDVCAVFLDLSKAFDKVPHRPLMDKLASLHVDPYVLRWRPVQRRWCTTDFVKTILKKINGMTLFTYNITHKFIFILTKLFLKRVQRLWE